MVLGLTQLLTEMNTRDISWRKGGRCVELTILPHSYGDCHEIWEPEPSGTLWARPCLHRDCFNLFSTCGEYSFSILTLIKEWLGRVKKD
jgi:hypothetical protein